MFIVYNQLRLTVHNTKIENDTEKISKPLRKDDMLYREAFHIFSLLLHIRYFKTNRQGNTELTSSVATDPGRASRQFLRIDFANSSGP